MPQRLRIIIISCKWTSLFNILYYLIRLLFSLIRSFFGFSSSWLTFFFFLAHFLFLCSRPFLPLFLFHYLSFFSHYYLLFVFSHLTSHLISFVCFLCSLSAFAQHTTTNQVYLCKFSRAFFSSTLWFSLFFRNSKQILLVETILVIFYPA